MPGGTSGHDQDQYPHIHEPAPGIIGVGIQRAGCGHGDHHGAQIAKRILDPAAQFDMPITPMKTIRLHALWPLAVRAVIAWGRLADF